MAESAVRSLIRLIVTIAILAAVYLFMVKPILDTTSDTINRAFDSSEDLQRSINDSLEASGVETISGPKEISNIGEVDLSTAIDNAPDKKTKRLLRCIDRADGNVSEIVDCQQRFVD